MESAAALGAGFGAGAEAGAGIGVGSSIGMGELTAAEMAALEAGAGGGDALAGGLTAAEAAKAGVGRAGITVGDVLAGGAIASGVAAGAGAGNTSGATTDSTASNKAATLLRSQFEDWKKTYKPIELAAINQLSFNNPEVLPRALSEARAGAEGYSDKTSGILGRQIRALGQRPTEGQAQTTGRMLNLDRAAMIAGAENTARENVRTQDETILLGTSPNPNIVKAT
jgi:hypothetical protein